MEIDWLEGRARVTPEELAIKDSESNEIWTYQNLNSRAINLANHLIEAGVKKGERVALIAPNHICYFDFFFACAKIGAIFVPINWRLSAYEIERVLRDCKPSLIGMVEECQSALLERLTYPHLLIDCEDYQKLLSKPTTDKIFCEVGLEDPLAILYTSGSTGYPKGVVLTHQTVIANAINTVISWNIKKSDITFTSTPMFHTAGLFALIIPILMVGGKVILYKKYEPDSAIKLIHTEECTVVFMVPTMYHSMIHSPLFAEFSFDSIDTFISGGAPCSRQIYQAFIKKGIHFKEAYGMTEAGPNNFFIDPAIAREKIGSVGKPFIFNEVKIVKDDFQEAGPDEVGEIVISGKHLFLSYWNNQTETKKVLLNGQYYTGDLGKYDKSGYFYIVGRKKEIIISGGEKIYPLEIENIIDEHPAVNEKVVVGLQDEKWGEMIVAMVSVKQEHFLTEKELQLFCAQKLARFKLPRKIVFVDKLPKNHSGKIDKKRVIEICQKA